MNVGPDDPEILEEDEVSGPMDDCAECDRDYSESLRDAEE